MIQELPDYNPNGTANPKGDAAYWRARAEKAEADAERLAAELRLEQNPGNTCEALRLHDALAETMARKQRTDKALQNILEERERQEAKWGEQNHDPYTYLTILMEEVGEYAQACLQTQFGGKHGGLDRMREEAIQTAAVALAIVECLDRSKWQWPHVTKGGEG